MGAVVEGLVKAMRVGIPNRRRFSTCVCVCVKCLYGNPSMYKLIKNNNLIFKKERSFSKVKMRE